MPGEVHKWYIEHTTPGFANMFGVVSFLKSYRTQYQEMEIAVTPDFGRILILDGKIQSSEYDEYMYHEALVHPAMLMCPAPRRVLVIGGGEGATLREVFKHPMVERLVMVDLDQEVVEHCRELLESWHCGSFDDDRLELVFADAREYLENTDERFDVILSDVPEPVEGGPAMKLFTRQYFELLKNHLTENGFVTLQAGFFSLPFIEMHSAILNTMKPVMGFCRSYRAFIPSFNADWSFIMASPQQLELLTDHQYDQAIDERKLTLDFFDGTTAIGMFAVPKDIRRRLESETTVIDDDHLLTIY